MVLDISEAILFPQGLDPLEVVPLVSFTFLLTGLFGIKIKVMEEEY